MNKTKILKWLKDWIGFIIFMSLLLISRYFFWATVNVDGHSMDPTLANKEMLFIVKNSKIDRFDIVVAQEEDNGKTKDIIKRVIGLPGDTITYKNDQLYINNEMVNEPYLDEYKQKFQEDKLQSTYSYNAYFQQLAQEATAFTIDSQKQASFTIEVPEGQYLLLGDDRIVSKDSRAVGTFKKEQITGEAKFRFYPFNRMGTVE